MKNNYGFTLVELMIVVAIIGVMSAIAYPSYTSYMKKSGRADAKVALQKLADKQERFYLQCNTYTTSFAPMEANCGGVSGLNTSQLSEEGYYALEITSADASGFELTATAVATKSQAKDITDPAVPELAGNCTQFLLDSTGLKKAPLANDPNGTDPDVADCW